MSREATERRRAAARAAEQARRAKAARRRRELIGAGVALLVVVVVVVVYFIQSGRTSASPDAAQPGNVTDGAVVLGEADAAVTIDVYEDFQCPICRDFESGAADTLAALVADGTASVRYHPIAILDRASTDEYSTRSANAAAAVADAAGAQAFLSFHAALYANQPAEGGAGLSDDTLIQYAADAGADSAAVADAINDGTYEDWVSTQTDEASAAGVNSTPTVLVNGTVLADRSAAGLTAAVQAAQG